MYSEEMKDGKQEVIDWEEVLVWKDGKKLPLSDYVLTDTWNKIPLFSFDKWKFVTKEWIFVSSAMKTAINLTNYRRHIQNEYNQKHWITPTTVYSEIKDIGIKINKKSYDGLSQNDLEKELKKLEFEMGVAAANMEYELAADLRDQIIELKRGVKRL